jgi:predicted peroxiredoxin
MAEKVAIVCTCGPEDPERATIPFVLATAALVSNVHVVKGFQVNGVLFMKKALPNMFWPAAFLP